MRNHTPKFLWIALALLAPACGGSQVEPPGEDDTTAGDEETGATGETGEQPCVEDPQDPVEILNACSDATCEPFINSRERLPLLKDDGSLPPLP